MRIFNEDKTLELNANEIDYKNGYLKPDKLLIAHHEASPFKQGKTAQEIANELTAQGVIVETGGDGNLYRVVKEYEGGGNDVALIDSEPDILAVDAYDEYENIEVYIPYTADELKKIADGKRHSELKAELSIIKEDIEQEVFGLVRDDFAQKKARAAEIVNELRVLEGKEPREVQSD